jgi:hypothetical protein
MNNNRDVRYVAYPSSVWLGLVKGLLLGVIFLFLGIFAFACIVGLLGVLAWLSRTVGGF